jgi:RecA/RadA recombinase
MAKSKKVSSLDDETSYDTETGEVVSEPLPVSTTKVSKIKKSSKLEKEVDDELDMEDVYDAYSDHLDSMIEAVEKTHALSSGLFEFERISSGSLVVDQILNGGLRPGFYVNSGMEASAKSTLAVTTLAQAIKAKLRIIVFYDSENALDYDYSGEIISSITGKDPLLLMGVFNSKTGKYTVKPAYRYYTENRMEAVFKSMHNILSFMPDKRFSKKIDSWCLVFENDKESKALMDSTGLTVSKKASDGTGKHWCPISDGKPQALFIIDSLPALVPEKIDKDEMSDNSLGINARFFAKLLPLVRGKLAGTATIMLAVNQIRDNPGARFGDPQYEPGGNTIKFASDVRLRMRGVVVPVGWDRDPKISDVNIEESVFEGGVDSYQFKSVKNTKSKFGPPKRHGQIRIWISDRDGNPHGIDPVFDCFTALNSMGFIKGKRTKKFTIETTNPYFKDITGGQFDWWSFKTAILAEFYKTEELIKLATDNDLYPYGIYEATQKLISSGDFNSYYIEAKDSDE